MKNYLKLFVIVLLAHILLILFFSREAQISNQTPPQQQSSRSITYRDRQTQERIWVGIGILPCDTYDGIGVQYDEITSVVSYVAKNGPADKAGLRAYDLIISPLSNMQLSFGQILDVKVKRNNEILQLTMKVDRICKE